MSKDIGIQVIGDANEGDVMDLKIKVQRDSLGLISQGIVIGNTLEQNKAFILIAHPSDFKMNPTLGVGIEDILLGSNLLEYRHKVREHFTMDGLKITSLDLYSIDRIKIEAEYEQDS